jgi:hypothetical protein
LLEGCRIGVSSRLKKLELLRQLNVCDIETTHLPKNEVEEKDAWKAACPTKSDIGHLFLVDLICIHYQKWPRCDRECGLENSETM